MGGTPMSASAEAGVDRPVHPTDDARVRLVSAEPSEASLPSVLVVGGEPIRALVARAADSLPVRIVEAGSLGEAEANLAAHEADVMVVEEGLLEAIPAARWERLGSCPLVASTVVCVVADGTQSSGDRARAVGAWTCSLEDHRLLHAFLTACVAIARRARRGFTLAGTLPKGGIRLVLPLIEAERRSGRLVVQPSAPGEDYVSVWIRDGEPVVAYAGGVRLEDPLSRACEVTSGLFRFTETTVDREVLESLDAWSDRLCTSGGSPRRRPSPRQLKERLRVALSSARSIGEMRDAVQSLLDLGIDRAAEEGDMSLMDTLADVSILLQKNKIDEAFKLLKTILK